MKTSVITNTFILVYLSFRFCIGYNKRDWFGLREVKVMQLDGWFLWFILFWIVVLITFFAIGGFFMFRKFLKRLPKADGKSDMDWEEYYVSKTSRSEERRVGKACRVWWWSG